MNSLVPDTALAVRQMIGVRLTLSGYIRFILTRVSTPSIIGIR